MPRWFRLPAAMARFRRRQRRSYPLFIEALEERLVLSGPAPAASFTRTGIAGTAIASLSSGRGWITYSPAAPFAAFTTNPNDQAYKTVKTDLTRIKTQGFEGIVTYATDPNLITGEVPAIAHGLGLKVIAGLFWSNDTDLYRQRDFILGTVDPNGYAQGYIVGNENLNTGSGETIQTLTNEMANLKQKTNKPVTTAETYPQYTAGPNATALLKLGDWVAPNIQVVYDPFIQGLISQGTFTIDKAAAQGATLFGNILQASAAAGGGVDVIAHEYWWPSDSTIAANRSYANPDNQKLYLLNSVQAHNLSNKLKFVWGDAVNQDWRTSDPGSLGVEPFFGYWKSDGTAKPVVAALQPFYKLPQALRGSPYAVGADAGGGPQVNVYDADSGAPLATFSAYDPNFTGGVRVAVADVNRDGSAEIITVPGPGGGPNVRLFDGNTFTPLPDPLGNFMAFDPGFTGGVSVAAGDVNGDGYSDVIVGADAGGGPNVVVFSGMDGSVLQNFMAFDSAFTGGVRLAAADTNADGFDDVIVSPGPGGGPNVRVFSGANLAPLLSFFAYDAAFTGGVTVAAADLNGDGLAEIVTGAGAGGGPDVAVFSGIDAAFLRGFFAFGAAFTGGARVTASDLLGDGLAEIVVGAGPGGGPSVCEFDGQTLELLDSFFAFPPGFTGGVLVGGP